MPLRGRTVEDAGPYIWMVGFYLIRHGYRRATFPKGEGIKTFSRGEGGFSGGHTWTPEKTEVECGRRTFSFVNAKTC